MVTEMKAIYSESPAVFLDRLNLPWNIIVSEIFK